MRRFRSPGTSSSALRSFKTPTHLLGEANRDVRKADVLFEAAVSQSRPTGQLFSLSSSAANYLRGPPAAGESPLSSLPPYNEFPEKKTSIKRLLSLVKDKSVSRRSV